MFFGGHPNRFSLSVSKRSHEFASIDAEYTHRQPSSAQSRHVWAAKSSHKSKSDPPQGVLSVNEMLRQLPYRERPKRGGLPLLVAVLIWESSVGLQVLFPSRQSQTAGQSKS